MLICVQKINFITHFFLKILQRNSELAILGNFGHAWQHKPKLIVSIWRNLCRLYADNKLNSSFTFSLRYRKDFVNLLFWVLGKCLATHTQIDTINVQKTSVYLHAKHYFIIHLFLEIFRFNNPAIWLGNSNLARNPTTRILPDMGFEVKYQ